ncbi:MAG TPA: DUF536 domain-containing protein [Sedimentibacter sp.]|nr:DUF536 domain-containing protein [Sedimentibacter sp.]
MAKTIKQIADFLNCPKIKVYRYIKFNRIKETFIEGNTMYFDETIVDAIVQAFREHETVENVSETYHETVETYHDTMIETLLKQLEIKDEQLSVKDQQLSEKDKQIEQLTLTLHASQETQNQLATSLNTAQALHAGTIQQNLIEDTKEQKGFFSKVFGKKSKKEE